MNAIEEQRLVQLIEHLEQKPPDTFSFSVIRHDRHCGTVCCAIGDTPHLFPDLVEYVPSRRLSLHDDNPLWDVRMIGSHAHSFACVARDLFGMPRGRAGNLFAPGCQQHVHPDLPYCGGGAGPKEVAAMLRKYLELYHSNQLSK